MAVDNLYFPAYFNDWGAIRDAVTPEQGWTLFTLCLDYAAGETPEPCSDPVISAFFKLLSGGIDRSRAAQEEKAQKRRYARYCGLCKESETDPLRFDDWAAQVDTCQQTSTHVDKGDNHNPIIIQSKSESKSKSKSKSNIIMGDKSQRAARFTPPSLEDVQAYCEERKNDVDPQRFIDHYTANGWMRGKTKIKDWRAAVRTWERRNQNGRDHGYGDPDQEIPGILRL